MDRPRPGVPGVVMVVPLRYCLTSNTRPTTESQPVGRNKRSPGRKSWVAVVNVDFQPRQGRHSGFVPPAETGSEFMFLAYPGLTSWATFVPPFGLDSAVLAHGAKHRLSGHWSAVSSPYTVTVFQNWSWGG